MKLILDGDACPDISLITNICRKYNVRTLIFCDNSHNIDNDYAEIIYCDKGYQNVDIHIINKLEENDIVITQDYGLALLCLSKTKYVIHPNGFLYSDNTIDNMLSNRHISSKLRKSGVRIKGPKKRLETNRVNLLKLVEDIINSML